MLVFQKGLLALLLATLAAESSATVDLVELAYYESLIIAKSAAALLYELPTDASSFKATSNDPEYYGTYDFVVIGAGSAGAVVANRLSQYSNWSVFLIDAGDYPTDFTSIPGMTPLVFFSDHNWGYYSTPQNYACLGMTDRKCPIPRGRGIGGSSQLNGMIYSRGNALDYDNWATAVNDSSWNYESALRYYKDLEDLHVNTDDVPVEWDYHGFGGDFNVEFHVPTSSVTPLFLDASVELGYNVTDYNGESQLGASVYQLNTKHGRRFDTGTAFVTPVLDRTNLEVSTGSYVTKIEIDDATGVATGVIFTKDKKTYRVNVSMEVVLSAGAIGSPQILMQSGIGPKEHLEDLNITVLRDLPVGSALGEHVLNLVLFTSNNFAPTQLLVQQVADYLDGGGTLASYFSIEAAGFIKTDVETTDDYPDVEIALTRVPPTTFIKKVYGYNDETYNALFNVFGVTSFIAAEVVLVHPKSRGTVRLSSNDPFDYPLIDYNLLYESDDIEAMYQGVQHILELANTTAFRSIDLTLQAGDLPACSDTEYLSKEFWYCYLRQTSGASYHPFGSCNSGTDPKTAVVDNNLLVFGVSNLRVADASVFPVHITGHTSNPCTVVGARVADIIKAKYGVSR